MNKKHSIAEINRMSAEEAIHRCYERRIEAAIEDCRIDTALAYMKEELVFTQTGEGL